MGNIISASRRTDIPAFFSKWFFNRLKQGYCQVANPFNPNQVKTVELSQQEIDAFVFWTRNPLPFFEVLDFMETQQFLSIFLITLTNYPTELEPYLPPTNQVLETFNRLANKIGKERIAWRYDPIILSNKMPFSWHLENFSALAQKLSGKINRCIISFADFYKKTNTNLKPLEKSGWKFLAKEEALEQAGEFLSELKRIANDNGFNIFSCCESHISFLEAGIQQGACIDINWLQKLAKKTISSKRDKNQRPNCQCAKAIDIGKYHTCKHGCKYCYATSSYERAKKYQHDPDKDKL